jgi:integrase/recombinase XerD
VESGIKRYGKKCGLMIAPHDLRRTYAKLSYKNGAKLQQIQLNLGHASLTTTQKYLGTELDYSDSPGDYINISFG